MKVFLTLFCYLILTACASQKPVSVSLENTIPTLPYALSNHAVAQTLYNGEDQFFVFNGLTNLVSNGQKTNKDITNQAWVFRQNNWQALTVPENQPAVLASVAVTVKNHVYLFGGYTVADDHSEKSSPLVWQIDSESLIWQAMPEMPTPVDDAVALVYQNRYIYIVSGWHDVDNVDLVQVFDTYEKAWQQATPFPLPAVFGHAGAIVDNQMVICDGVKVIWESESKKRFEASPACALGTINQDDVTQIEWQNIPHYSGTAHYRMAATSANNQAAFAGGSDNPYNYNGIGYDGVPSEASSDVRIFNFDTHEWKKLSGLIPKTMDHRGLLYAKGEYIILAGMKADQILSPDVIKFKIKTPSEIGLKRREL